MNHEIQLIAPAGEIDQEWMDAILLSSDIRKRAEFLFTVLEKHFVHEVPLDDVLCGVDKVANEIISKISDFKTKYRNANVQNNPNVKPETQSIAFVSKEQLRKQLMLELLKENPQITRQELAERCGCSYQIAAKIIRMFNLPVARKLSEVN